MIKVYLIFDKQHTYIGSTSRNPRLRFIEVKSENKILLNWETAKIKILEECEIKERFERENFWIDHYKKTSLNKCRASQGPVGRKVSDELKIIAREIMKKRWQENREQMLKNVNSHKTSESQRAAGLKGAAARWKVG